MLCISLMCYGNNHVASHGQVVASGSIARITQTVWSNKFPGEASAFFKTCLETLASKIEESKRYNRGVNLDVYDLSVGHFNGNGQAFVTWIISPYYYCPMDKDGFGEEEEF